VGHDVNTRLLDELAEDNRGARQYVSEQEDLELKLSGFYTMIAHPVLSDLELAFGGADVQDVHPKTLPDLFKGSEIVVFGRYREAGEHTITLRGRRGDESATFTWEKSFARRETGHDYLPRLWASRKIGYLLDEIRLHGEDPELKEEVVHLAKRHGILTPYTSFLVLEEDQRLAAAGQPISARAASRALGLRGANEMRLRRESFYGLSGEGAVDASQSVAKQRFAERSADAITWDAHFALTPAAPHDDLTVGGVAGAPGVHVREASPVRFVASRTFYRDGERWLDSAYDEQRETIKVQLFSEAYFQLLREHPDAGKFLALGPRVVVVLNDKVYETTE
jgi:Ca-activated chloride channel family protein